MNEEIKENPKLFITVVVIAIIAVTILAMFLLFIVWGPKDNTENKNSNSDSITNSLGSTKVGEYTSIYVDEKKVVDKYCKEILNVLESNDEIQLYNMVLPEYLTFKGIGRSELKKTLTQKGIIGKKIKLIDYKAIIHPRYGKIFEVNVKSYDDSYSDKFWIIQKSPNNFKLSFDNFIGLDTKVKSYTKEGFRLDITEVKELTTMVSVKLSISNVSGRNMIINRENNYENIYLGLSTGTEIRMGTTWLSGATKELTTGDTFNLNVEFSIQGFASGSAKSIVIKNVYDTLTKETKDIEFVI